MIRIALIGCKEAAVDYTEAPFRLQVAKFASVVAFPDGQRNAPDPRHAAIGFWPVFRLEVRDELRDDRGPHPRSLVDDLRSTLDRLRIVQQEWRDRRRMTRQRQITGGCRGWYTSGDGDSMVVVFWRHASDVR